MKVSIPFDQRVFRDFRLFVVPALIGQVDKVTVGSRCFAVNVEMISIPFPDDLPAEGLLGASFLRHFLVSMDYAKGKLVLTTR